MSYMVEGDNYKFFIDENGKHYFNLRVFEDIIKVPGKTIRNGIVNFKQRRSEHWASIEMKHDVFIRHDSIPKNSSTRYRIRAACDLVAQIKMLTNDAESELLVTEEMLHFDEIERTVSTLWPNYTKEYREIFKQDISKIERYSKTELLLLTLSEYHKRGLSWGLLYKIFDKLSKKLKLPFTTISPSYLEKKITLGLKLGFARILLHKNRGRASTKKKSASVIDYIIGLWLKPEALSKVQIVERVNSKLHEKVSYATVKRYTSDAAVKNLGKIATKGRKWYRNNFRPYVVGIDPKFVGDMFAADGSRLQFVCRGVDGNYKFLRYYIVVDWSSRKIIGEAVGESETSYLALAAFQIAIKRVGFLPREVMVDGGSAHTSEEFKKFIRRTSCLGVLWHKENDPRANITERIIGTFQTRICGGKRFYVGDSIKSTRERGKPSPEVIELYRDRSVLITEDELKHEFYEFVKEYNDKKF